MGRVFDSVVPEEHYKSEVSRLSADIHDLEQQISKLKSVLMDLKIDIRNVQFYEPDDYDLDNVVEKIEEAIKGG